MRARIRYLSVRYVSALVSMFLLGSAPAVVADEAADRAAIESSAQAWIKAFNTRAVDGLVALATDDVLVLDGNAPSSGLARARDVWKHAAALAQGPTTSTTKEISIAGDVAWRVGLLTYPLANGEAGHGQSLEIWKRVNGGWKIHRQMSSSILAQSIRPAPSLPVLDAPAH